MVATAGFECPDCKGKGEKLPWKYSLEPYEKCDRCKGSGIIYYTQVDNV